jgi:hypothetical protein
MLWTISVLDLARLLAPFVLGYSVILGLATAILACIQVSTTQPQTSYAQSGYGYG